MFTSFIVNDDVVKPANNPKNIDFNGAETPIPVLQENVVTDTDDTMKIYLRFRPLPVSQRESPFSICDYRSISASPPEQSVTYKNLLHGYGKGYQKFSFSKVFIPDSDQDVIFNETAQILLEDFTRNNDRLLFTYGTTSSGKTFTMNGNKNNIGIIPRSLFSLFKSTKLNNNPAFMPIDFAEVLEIKKPDIQKLLKEKSILLKISEKESSDVLQIFNQTDLVNEEDIQSGFMEFQNSNSNYETTFWISYTEIYNELIYDLLDPVAIANLSSNNKLKRPILDIRTARNGGSYVRGLKSYPVYSAEEAYRLLLVGRRSQTMGATKLNQNSSRSHTIFTIKAVRITPGSEYLSKVSNFSFCDLAGSERTDKAQTSGMLQKEASNINSSLLALGRCIDVLKHNQSNPNNLRIVPYRDSKLTRLFQTYLGGNGKAAMIVCINQDPILFDESLQVLKFSALAKKVVLHEKEKPATTGIGKGASSERLSLYRRLGMNTPKPGDRKRDTIESLLNGDDYDLDETVENASEEEYEEEYDAQELLNIIESLKTELIAVRKAKVADEAKLREKLNREYVETIMSMERDHLRNTQALRDNMQEHMKKRARSERNKAYRQMKKRKIQPEFEDMIEDHESSSEENLNVISLENEVSDLKNQLKDSQEEAVEAKETIEILLQEKQQLEVRCRTLEFQLQVSSKSKTCQSKAVSIQTELIDNIIESSIDEDSIIEIDCSTKANLSHLKEPLIISNNKKQISKTRFSALTSNPSVSEDEDSMDNPEKIHQTFFEPLITPKKGKMENLCTPCTVKKNVKLELINEEENEESFLKHEQECAIDDLQNQLSNLEIEVCEKASQIGALKNQLEIMENKLSSREKSIEKYIEKEMDAGKRLNNVLAQLQIPIDNEAGKLKRKLKILFKAIQQIQSGFREINHVIPSNLPSKQRVLTDSTNIENQDVKIDANLVVAHINQLGHQLQTAREDYYQIISICNQCIVDQACSFLEIQLERLTVDTCLEDISQLFQTIWNCAIEKVESITSSIVDFNGETNESVNSQELSRGISDGSQMCEGEAESAQSQVDQIDSDSSTNYRLEF